MTIAAGFTLQNGVLICADSQMTTNSAKYSASKIFPVTFGGPNNPGPKIAFAYTGLEPHARRAFGNCQEALSKIHRESPSDLDNEGIRACIEKTLGAFHRKHIFKHPLYGTGRQDVPFVQFIIGLWSHVTGRTSLLVTNEDIVNEIYTYDCIGIGADFARYLCGYLFRHNMPLKEVTTLAIHALQQTKNNVPYCGNETLFIRLEVGGLMSGVNSFDISLEESYSDQFMMLTSRLLPDLVDGEKDFDKTMKAFEGLARAIREDHENKRKQFNAFWEGFSRPDSP
jgi:20S proteasome alpha/beta subunit